MYKGMANFVQRRRLALAHHLESAKAYTMEGLFYENEETNIGLALTTLDVLDRSGCIRPFGIRRRLRFWHV